MPQIRPGGFLEGERMRSLSAEAWCMWPFFYSAANGFGRFQLDYKSILATAFRYYPKTPAESDVYSWLREYKENDLLFVYKANDGAVWGAFDSRSGQRYFNAEDKRSPAPPEPDFTQWMEAYESKKKNAGVHKLGSVLHELLDSEPTQHGLSFNAEASSNKRRVSVDSPLNEREVSAQPPQHNTENTTHSSSTQHTEGSAEGNQSESNPAGGDPELWHGLLYAANTVGLLFAEGQLDALRDRWRSLALEERREAIAGIEIRVKTGEYADAHYVPALKKYLFDKLWTARLRPGPQLVERKKPEADTSFLDEIIAKGKKSNGSG